MYETPEVWESNEVFSWFYTDVSEWIGSFESVQIHVDSLTDSFNSPEEESSVSWSRNRSSY